MSKFTEEKLEQAIITLLGAQGYPHVRGDTLPPVFFKVVVAKIMLRPSPFPALVYPG